MYEFSVGLEVTNDELYQKYREGMIPILKEHGGGFRYDFKVNETLINEEGRNINRVFLIYFGSKELMQKFFSHPDYLEVKKEFYEPSVANTTIMSEYHRE